MIFHDSDIIVAPATPIGGAICIIRLSGEGSIALCDKIFKGRKPLCQAKTSTIHYGYIMDEEKIVDDVMVSVFRTPHSYTGEESVEISTHASRFIVSHILSMLTALGARLAEAGEFTRRAFLSGRMDLSQAEAVADIIAADSQSSHAIASTQMRGAYSSELQSLRDKLLHITSLLELELDFSEEDVEFANRDELRQLLNSILERVTSLKQTFSLGNAIKEGVVVAIAGRPNVGKSTLLNRLAGEERAMVSHIAGTTRDTIEITRNIDGVIFRFIDTAGLHATTDQLEQMGIERTEQALRKARIILWMCEKAERDISSDLNGYTPTAEQHIYRIINKIDLNNEALTNTNQEPYPTLRISAKTGEGVEALIQALGSAIDTTMASNGDVVVSSQRHYEALHQAAAALHAALSALDNNTPTDLLSEDIRQVMHHLGTITGEITTTDILQNIFSHFCIGK